MYLVIDCSTSPGAVFYYFKEQWQKSSFVIGEPATILQAIKQILAFHKQNLEGLVAVGAVVGKGSFTATRVATTTANTLAFALKIPVVTITTTNQTTMLAALKNAKQGEYISAAYSAEPRIGG